MEYVLGFDGGGTKTAMIALDLQGNTVARLEGGASNPNAVSFEVAVDHLTDLLTRVFESGLKPSSCRGICFGLSGVELEQEQTRMKQALEARLEQYDANIPFNITNDAEIALMAGLDQNCGIIVISGTGAIVYGFTPDRKRMRAGGWGHILGDKGSGYEIGLQTLQAVMRSYDGVEPPTELTQLILEKHGLPSPEQLRTYIYQPFITKQHIADHAELCIRAAEKGDEAARRIIMEAAADLASLTLAMIAKDEWFQQSPIAITGSIFKHSPLFVHTYKERLDADAKQTSIILTEQPPSYGAAKLALKIHVLN